MATYIRLTDYKSSDEKEQEFFNPENRYEAKQEEFSKIPGSPIAYWIVEKIFQIFSNNDSLNLHGSLREGIHTGKNELFLRYWNEVSYSKFSDKEILVSDIDAHSKKWIPYNKGGSYRKWFGNNEYVLRFDTQSRNEMSLLSGHVRPSQLLYLKSGGTWSALSSGKLGVRFYPDGYLFDSKGQVIVTTDSLIEKIAYMNSKVAKVFFDILMPTLDYKCGDVKKTPYIPSSNGVEFFQVIQQNIDISKEEWDSRETSWDFAQNEILRILNDEFLILNEKKPTIETVYNRYCEYWSEKFFQLHANEEELNRLFIDIYELQDELTPEVELKDITILKNEAKIIDDELVFQREEIMKQFISYGVGVMFGRYSLDSEGLLIANMGQEIPSQAENDGGVSFEIDDDNVIPVLEDDYFKDDIASRFVQFVKASFGEEDLSENIRFIENSLGSTLRKYFVKGFYEDHLKRYKKRPIYWMVSSPKKSFNALFYMHRYESDIFARVQTSYLREYLTKLEASKQTLHVLSEDESNSATERRKATKEIDSITKKVDEIIKYDRNHLTAFAQDKIEIDLDDGVKVNYCKFKGVLYPISGLCK